MLNYLYERLVKRYEARPEPTGRNDEDVWKTFKTELEPRNVLNHLQPKRISARDYEYEFEHAWKNETWRVYEPISFDLVEAESISSKAHRWLGQVITLRESPEKFTLYLLVGEPSAEG